jgi:hypothetical protein
MPPAFPKYMLSSTPALLLSSAYTIAEHLLIICKKCASPDGYLKQVGTVPVLFSKNGCPVNVLRVNECRTVLV